MWSSPKDQTFKTRPSLSTRRKHLTILGEENKYPNCALDSKDQTFKSKIDTFKLKTNPKERDQIRELYICSFVINIWDCTQILWNAIQISFVTFLCLQILTRSMGQSLPLILFSKIKTSKSKQHFLQRSHAHKKVASQASKKNIGSLSRRSCQTVIVPKRWV